jgi:hypothetical protein
MQSPITSSRPKNLNPFLQALERLRPHLARRRAKHERARQLPVRVDGPGARDLLVDQWVVVLQARAETLELERRPHGQLVHGRRLGAPGGEAVGVDGEFLLHAADDGAVGVEEDLACVSGACEVGRKKDFGRGRDERFRSLL